MFRIAFTGGMGAGKSFAAGIAQEYGIEELGYSYVDRLSFANAVRNTAWDLFSDAMYEAESMGEKPRELLQAIGAAMRDIDPYVWVKKLEYAGADTVIDDVRYSNEAEMLRAYSFTVIRIDVPLEIRKWRLGNPVWWDMAVAHESENQEVIADIAIDGDCSREEFRERVIAAIREVDNGEE